MRRTSWEWDCPKASFPAQEKNPQLHKESQIKPDVFALTAGLAPLMPALDLSQLKKSPQSNEKVEDFMARSCVLPSLSINASESFDGEINIEYYMPPKLYLDVTWQWLALTNSARKDDIKLSHWARVVNGVPPTGDYSFAKYDKSVGITRYTDEEYVKYLADPKWTKEETDQLFVLCERFQLRFIVIADRFPSSRTVEELKDRYFSVSRAMLMARNPSSGNVAVHPLVKEPYNVSQEVERKRALSLILSQTRRQEQRDEEVLAEAKKIAASRIATEDAEVSQLVVASNAGADVKESANPVETVSPSNMQLPPIVVPTTMTTDNASTLASLRMLYVYLRTYALEQLVQSDSSSVGVRTIKRVEQTLQELGVNLKPRVPTKAVCAEHLELRNEILTLLNLQKQLQNKEAEGSSFRDGSYGETTGTPKHSHYDGDQDRTFVPDNTSSGGERNVKRDQKRKAPGRLSEAPPSPAQSKRQRKLNS